MVSKIPLFLQSTWKGGQWAGRWEAQQSMGSSPEQQQHGKASRLTRVALQAWEQWTALPRSWARIRGSSRAQEAGQPHQAPRPTQSFLGNKYATVPCVSAQGSKTHMHTPLLSQEDTPQLSSVRKGWGGEY